MVAQGKLEAGRAQLSDRCRKSFPDVSRAKRTPAGSTGLQSVKGGDALPPEALVNRATFVVGPWQPSTPNFSRSAPPLTITSWWLLGADSEASWPIPQRLHA